MSIPTAALWIGTYPASGDAPGTGEGVWRVGVDGSGRFTGGELVTQVAAPSFLALDPSGRTLLAVTEAEPGTLTSFRVSDAGMLTPAGSTPSGGTSPCHVVATDTAAWVANYGDGVAAVVGLSADGALATPRTFPHAGTGPVEDRQEGPHAHFVHVWGDRVLVSDLGTDELRTYPLDAGAAAPGEAPSGEVAVVLPPGTGPRHLAELADGTILLVGELDCRLHVLVPAGPGRLAHVGSVAITGRTMPDGSAGYPSHVTVDGDLVHVGVRGPDVLSVLRVHDAAVAPDGVDAAVPGAVAHLVLENVADIDLGAGAWPRHHAVLADGGVVVVAAQNTDELIAVRLDRTSGQGEVTDRLELPVPACVLEA
ncbi:lactonase family protein [Promicromonospora iranensis]|uniref:6-phosphogluconolactonase (Cycloisomerase 2 family) n=1 Tax=Promicromonospora iranensis TaxID=1105144 RepID=A0ABU2CQY7_9MICO|nr:beta-propeller fold lactonase family protein [Promicromonospora iranensis]MDR7383757.1 6-phosphogluconolactonase (cycloisomerase 2 family) [Promicromonospora iranensis]